MSKLTRIVYQLSDEEYDLLYHALVDGEALKSADLLKILREEQLEEEQIRERLEVSSNAYYALRSRLNKKIESFYLDQLEGNKSEIFKQVANISELVLTKSRTVATITLRNLEKELANFDFFHELTLVYQALKKIHLNTPEYFQYSQLYNKHNAQLLAFEKTETLTSEYFKAFNLSLLNLETTESNECKLIRESIESINNRYKSHRIFTVKSLSELFHAINQKNQRFQGKKITKQFEELDRIITVYDTDILYKHLKWVVSYLKLLYYFRINSREEIKKSFLELDPIVGRLLYNYAYFSSTPFYLIVKLETAIKEGETVFLERNNQVIFRNFDPDPAYPFATTVYFYYRAFSAYFGADFDLAMDYISQAMATLNIKDHEKMIIDLRLTLATFAYYKGDLEITTNQINYVQRIMRLSQNTDFIYSFRFMKILKAVLTDIDLCKKERKLEQYKEKFLAEAQPFQSPLRFLNLSQIKCQELMHYQTQSVNCK